MVDWTCPYCGLAPATEALRVLHEAGVDDHHLECSHQDIDAIVAIQRPRVSYAGKVWG
jgi:hypothetical protein